MRINTVRLRALIGWLGMLLPWIVVLLIGYIPQSISETWYTNACTVFMIILGSASMLLISYKGYEKIDDFLLTCSGIAGFGICLFPCSVPTVSGKVGAFLIDSEISNTIHLACAIVFFGILAYNSFFLFTKGTGEMTKRKKIRNIIYRVCGVGMAASFLIMLLPSFRIQVWLTEACSLLFFSVSFLTKADIYPWLACDGKYIEKRWQGTKRKGEEVVVSGTEYVSVLQKLILRKFRCLIINDEDGKTLILGNGFVQWSIPVEPIEKYLTADRNQTTPKQKF